jgi:hypothetical protein
VPALCRQAFGKGSVDLHARCLHFASYPTKPRLLALQYLQYKAAGIDWAFCCGCHRWMTLLCVLGLLII